MESTGVNEDTFLRGASNNQLMLATVVATEQQFSGIVESRIPLMLTTITAHLVAGKFLEQ